MDNSLPSWKASQLWWYCLEGVIIRSKRGEMLNIRNWPNDGSIDWKRTRFRNQTISITSMESENNRIHFDVEPMPNNNDKHYLNEVLETIAKTWRKPKSGLVLSSTQHQGIIGSLKRTIGSWSEGTRVAQQMTFATNSSKDCEMIDWDLLYKSKKKSGLVEDCL